jgi:ribosomal protein S18 acetylase RimI-like enzyme
LASLLGRIEEFTQEEAQVALELIDGSLAPSDDPFGYRCLVALADEGEDAALWGYLCYGRTPMTERAYDLYWVAVEPSLQGVGVGRRLCGALEDTVREAGGGIIRVETSAQEAYGKTVRFYQRIAYVEGGRLPDFYKPGDDLIVFYKWV